ncbi:hypothetical protein ACS0TY_008548 [Phlomoides rotata]
MGEDIYRVLYASHSIHVHGTCPQGVTAFGVRQASSRCCEGFGAFSIHQKYIKKRVTMRTIDRKNAMNMLLLNTVVVVSIGIIILTINKHRRRPGVHRRTFTILERIPA